MRENPHHYAIRRASETGRAYIVCIHPETGEPGPAFLDCPENRRNARDGGYVRVVRHSPRGSALPPATR